MKFVRRIVLKYGLVQRSNKTDGSFDRLCILVGGVPKVWAKPFDGNRPNPAQEGLCSVVGQETHKLIAIIHQADVGKLLQRHRVQEGCHFVAESARAKA